MCPNPMAPMLRRSEVLETFNWVTKDVATLYPLLESSQTIPAQIFATPVINRHRAPVQVVCLHQAEEAAIRQRAEDLLHYVRIEDRADDLAKNLSYGDQRRLEIARALATEPKLLCLDEPAAGMNATETEELRDLIDGIRRDGTTILLIEHDVKLVMGLCDRVAVLDYGALVIEDVPAVVQKDQRVIEAYLGA